MPKEEKKPQTIWEGLFKFGIVGLAFVGIVYTIRFLLGI